MASFPVLSFRDAKQIRVITKKLRLKSSDIAKLEEAQKAGVAPETAMANLLGMEEGENPKTYLASKLSEGEFQLVKRLLGQATDTSFLD
jgi:hypothetical protein